MRALCVTFLLLGCEDTNDVRLGLHWSAVACTEPDAGPLLDRAEPPREGRRPRARVVVDFLRMHGASGCRAGQIRDGCRENPCDPFPESRWCGEVELPALDVDVRERAKAAASAITHELAGTVVTDDAPDGYVLVRLVVTAQDCNEVDGTSFDRDQLLGCGYSCPVVLDEAEGGVLLALDTLTTECTASVTRCASLDALPPE